MPIIDSRDETLDTTAKDVKRHHEKVKKAIKEKLREIISNEDIITQDAKGKKIRVPVKSIDIPDLRRGKRKKGKDGDGDGDGEGKGGKAGIGQGPGGKGKEIGRRPAEGEGEGEGGKKAGNQPGEDMIEAEFTVEEIIEMMLEDLGLPFLTKKSLATIEVSLGYKIAGSEKVGPMVLLKKRPTAKNAIKTFWAFLSVLEEQYKVAGRSQLDCYAALKETGGVLYEAMKLLENPDFKHDYKKVEPFLIVGNDDLRFFGVQNEKTSETNAVIFAILDVSGSMGLDKKYISRAILFWMVQFLRMQYTNVEIRFIVHHTNARFVEEKDFFRTSESGGTIGHTAFKLANDMIQEKYPPSIWNVYAFYFSDGEDFEPEQTAEEMRKMIESGINMLGFVNIKDEEEPSWRNIWSSASTDLIDYIKEAWPVATTKISTHPEGLDSIGNTMEVVMGMVGFPFLGVTISEKKHIFAVLRELLRKDR